MNNIPVYNTIGPGKDGGIIRRRETEQLLRSAAGILKCYDGAAGCYTTVMDRDGFCVRKAENENPMLSCELCGVHAEAREESRRLDEAYIYVCPAGVVYWTSPLYRKGCYSGALTSGQVILNGQKPGAEKNLSLCRGGIGADTLRAKIRELPEKSHPEIQAMARLLAVCAGEISAEGNNSGGMIRQIIQQKEFGKNHWETGRKKKQHPAARIIREYSLENERMLLAAFQRGDIETGSGILKELMASLLEVVPEDLEIIRFRAIELAVLLTRAASFDVSEEASAAEINCRNLKRIQESKNPEELMENLKLVAERLSGKIFSFQGIRHASVLRRAERYIWENYSRKLSLDEIARASGLSAPYFSTIFKEEMGVNLSNYINSLRVEKAATLLTGTGKLLSEIAGLCGFEDQSWFSKIFKSHTGMSPGKYRESGGSPDFRPRRNHQK